jgi:hypothetical protein
MKLVVLILGWIILKNVSGAAENSNLKKNIKIFVMMVVIGLTMGIQKKRNIRMNTNDIQSYYDQGYKEITAIMNSGEKQPLRLFVSTQNRLCYMAKGKRRSGYPIENIAKNIMSVKTKDKTELTAQEKYFDNLKKFKKIYTEKLHKNLWADLRDGYNRLDIADFEKFVNQSECEKNSSYDFYKLLLEYSEIHKLYINTENKYKTTTIQSNAPKNKRGFDYSHFQYYLGCIGKHLENKEDFRYAWESNYDVSVSGKLCDDGIYRAWLSLEFRGCGNGHYYLLINENQAVFAEDD